MADIRNLSQQSSSNGRLINQLTASSILKDTDLFPISSDNLTRSVSLGQIKSAITGGFYNKDEINSLLDTIRAQIKIFSDETFGTGVDVAEFRNEFNEKLQNLRNELTLIINDKEGSLKDKDNELLDLITINSSNITKINNDITQLENELKDADNALLELITSVSGDITTINNNITEINNDITKLEGRITYGTAIPTTLETGKIYLQYF